MSDMGELGQPGDYVDSTDPVASSELADDENVDLQKHKVDFSIEDQDPKARVSCSMCGTQTTKGKLIRGCLCTRCALKEFRTLEAELQDAKELKSMRTYCAASDHREVKTLPIQEWNGVFNINGVKLYPAKPLCKECLDVLTAYFVGYMEERGITRKGSNHTDNIYGEPYKGFVTSERIYADQKRLEAFVAAAKIIVLERGNNLNNIYTVIRERKQRILKEELKKKWEAQKSKEQQQQKPQQKEVVKDQPVEKWTEITPEFLRKLAETLWLERDKAFSKEQTIVILHKVVMTMAPWLPASYVDDLIASALSPYTRSI